MSSAAPRSRLFRNPPGKNTEWQPSFPDKNCKYGDGMIGQESERPVSAINHSFFAGSSEYQPPGANSTIAPSRCLQLKVKYIKVSDSPTWPHQQNSGLPIVDFG